MNITIANTDIRRDDAGRYCLNDLHRAAGGLPKHTPGRFTITQQFIGLCSVLSRIQDGVEPSTSAAGQGTFVARELVYAYAMWISPEFHVKVIQAYDAIASAPAIAAPKTMKDALRMALVEMEAREVAEAKLAIAAPKAEALDRLADKTGLFCLRDAAKALQVPERKLVAVMVEKQWLYRTGARGRLAAHAQAIRKGLLAHKTVELKDEKVSQQVMVQAAGMARLGLRTKEWGLTRP